MDIINGYELIGELKNDNSGYSKWGFARKAGKSYFIKEFLTPIYPLNNADISEEQRLRKQAICHEFEDEKRNFYNLLKQCANGNIITISDFFRYKNKYYIVTEKIDAAPMDMSTIASMNLSQKLLIVKVILHCVQSLHKHNIVHGDIKPDNILFKKTNGGIYTAKLIDFDSSFLSSEMPQGEELQGDMVYLSPEAFLAMAEGEMFLTSKIDVFALGILFHQYFSGALPGFDSDKYDYVFEAVLDDSDLQISERIPGFMKETIRQMLDKHPARRPSAQSIFDHLVSVEAAMNAHATAKRTEEDKKATENPSSDATPRLKNSMRSTEEKAISPSGSGSSYFKKPDDL